MGNINSLREVPGIRGALYRLGRLQQRTAFAIRAAADYASLPLNGTENPSVAAVVVGRNDDYMPDFKDRLFATLEWNLKHLIDEVIFVEWNPPADRELLSYDLTKKFERLRSYVVSPEIHREICQNSQIALLEYHAKNVGIRRANSTWILTTNADAALGANIVKTLLQSTLPPDTVWTAHRVDIGWRENEQQRIGLLDTLNYRRDIPYNELGTGEFNLASREWWHKARGYDESMVKHRIGCDVRGIAQMVKLGAKIQRAGTVLHLTHPTSCTEGVRPHHGEWATLEGIPYHNPDSWGLADRKETEIAERIWQIA